MDREFLDARPRRRGSIARLIEWMDGDGAEPVGRVCEWALVIFAVIGVASFLALGRDSGRGTDMHATSAHATSTDCEPKTRNAG